MHHRFTAATLAIGALAAALQAAPEAALAQSQASPQELTRPGELAQPPQGVSRERDAKDWTLTWTPVATLGTGIRTSRQRATLVPGGSNNGDDSDLNYAAGDTFSRVVKLNSEFKAVHRSGLGLELDGYAWYDDAQLHGKVAHGNNPSNYQPDAPLSDRGFARGARFQGAQVLGAYLFGTTAVGEGSAEFKLGKLSLERERGFSFTGGSRDLETRNAAAAARPGALANEGAVPVWAATARWNVNAALKLEAFLQFKPEGSVQAGCGTFAAVLDFSAPGCDRVFYSNVLSEQQNIARGIFTARGPDIEPRNRPDQFGLGASYVVREIGTRFGVLAAKYHSRDAFVDVLKGKGLGPAAGATYQIEHPTDKQLLSFSTATRIPALNLSVLNELSFIDHQPIQLNTTDLLNAFLAGQGPLGAEAKALPNGTLFRGYDLYKVAQLQTGLLKEFPGLWGSRKAVLGFEASVKHVMDLPDPSVRRYMRPENSGVCTTPGACTTNDGFVTSTAWAYRMHVGMEIDNVGGSGVLLRPALIFGQDVKGWSYDYAFIEGRKSARLSLDADFSRHVYANVSYTISRGGQFNIRKDMDFVMASVGYKL
ncbi:MAG: DUF1302 family protein [Mitsuaria chitosanitabida]|uniref:DUF1302 domain-containing protein n=1 Tax=Roseateles chitosanitabidus TaxID=65048 RepID=UPI001B1DCA66|nr:DUF1302 family protein [Roseateles chitosanitabidus]MBO9687293.1 DUF1302 family protein [Roseateles chitosanitabidus]